ncbi:unnamed protein product, partial [Scytosiphon promiscuus]
MSARKHRSSSHAPAAPVSNSSSPTRFQTPPRPKLATGRNTDTILKPSSVKASNGEAQIRAKEAGGTKRAPDAVGGVVAAAAPAPADASGARSEFRGYERPSGMLPAGRARQRPRPRSAVARVETTPHHGKMASPAATPTTAAGRAAMAVSAKLKAAAAVVGRTRVAPRPQSATAKRNTVTGTYGQRSQRESMERVMARIFQQHKNWTGEQGGQKEGFKGITGATDARRSQRPHSARTPASSPMAAVAATAQHQRQRPRPNPKPHTWAPAVTAKAPSALMAAATTAAASAATRTRAPVPNISGAYARLFGMKQPGAHRRVGVDPLDGFKKDHYRGSMTPTNTCETLVGQAVVSSDAKDGRVGQGAGARGGEMPRPKKASGETNIVESQATISTANTGSLTPPEGSSSAEGGRTAREGGIRAPPPVEPLTKASAECCSPQERLYLRRLMLDLQGSARSSLDFYRLGKVVGEGSFAQVRVAWHKLTGQRVAVKTYEKAKIKDENQWKRISQEVKLMEKLNHPRVIRLFETAESSKRIHLVMEYADGGNLCSYVKRRKRLDEGEAQRIFQELLEGVEYMHGVDIVHRDIKLENVLLGGNGRTNAKLVDFGFSAHVKNRRLLHVFCGTPSYMAPEIIKRQEYEGKPVDLWSLGVVLYAMLCGCFPFSGPRYPELYKNISKGVFRLPDWLSPTAISLLRGMLVTDPTRRLTLRQVCAHPWVLAARSLGRISTGNQFRPPAGVGIVRDGRSSPVPHEHLIGGSFQAAVTRRESFHISRDPTRDMCAASVKKMEAFGADGEEITRQVLARRHSCLTTTFYLLKNELSRTTSGSARPSSAVTPGSAAAKPSSATVRPSSAGRIGRLGADTSNGAANGKIRTADGAGSHRNASQGS